MVPTFPTGRRPKRPVRSSDMKAWAAELAGVPAWLFEESYSVVGDLGETISLLVPPGSESLDKPLHELMLEIQGLGAESDAYKKAWLSDLWRACGNDTRFVFNKLVMGSFRVGVSQQLVFKALAKAYSIDEKTVAHRLMGNWQARDTSLDQLLLNEGVTGDDSKPYPFYLATSSTCRLQSSGR